MSNQKGMGGQPPLVRIMAKTTKDSSGCITFHGARATGGYGFVRVDGKNLYVHRVAYEAQVGKIPDGLVIDHLCRNRACVNVDHLEAVTPQINTLRGVSHQARNARKTHCLRGHEFNEENTYIDKIGRRICRACKRKTAAEIRARKRMEKNELEK